MFFKIIAAIYWKTGSLKSKNVKEKYNVVTVELLF